MSEASITFLLPAVIELRPAEMTEELEGIPAVLQQSRTAEIGGDHLLTIR